VIDLFFRVTGVSKIQFELAKMLFFVSKRFLEISAVYTLLEASQ
jgi:hypothetical protein